MIMVVIENTYRAPMFFLNLYLNGDDELGILSLCLFVLAISV